jgi:hypothetical protein
VLTRRQTYDFWDLASDIGGFLAILVLIGYFLTSLYSNVMGEDMISQKLFYQRKGTKPPLACNSLANPNFKPQFT